MFIENNLIAMRERFSSPFAACTRWKVNVYGILFRPLFRAHSGIW